MGVVLGRCGIARGFGVEEEKVLRLTYGLVEMVEWSYEIIWVKPVF